MLLRPPMRHLFVLLALMLSGAYGADEALDLDKKHPLQIVAATAPEAAVIARRAGTILVGNFNHKGKTYLAEVPIESLQRSFLVISDFARGRWTRIAHAGVFFETPLNLPVRLYSLDNPSPVQELPGFMYSLYFAAPEGVEYDPREGMKDGAYQSTHTLKSPRELALYARACDALLKKAAEGAGKSTKDIKPSTLLYEIDFNPNENGNFARVLIEKGSAAGTSQPYNTLCKNCSHPIFAALEQVRPPSLLRKCPLLLTQLVKATPARSPILLFTRGLLRRKLAFEDHPLFQRAK
ncbi:hypothetical protein K2X33_10855 [bacterium]|nr:hypothetical protein [bacterium]